MIGPSAGQLPRLRGRGRKGTQGGGNPNGRGGKVVKRARQLASNGARTVAKGVKRAAGWIRNRLRGKNNPPLEGVSSRIITNKANNVERAKNIIKIIMDGEFLADKHGELFNNVWSGASNKKKETIKRIGREIANIKNKNSTNFEEYMNVEIFQKMKSQTFDKNLENFFDKASGKFELTKDGNNITVPENKNISTNIPSGSVLVNTLKQFINAGNRKSKFIQNGKTNEQLNNFRVINNLQNISRKNLIEFILKISACIEGPPTRGESTFLEHAALGMVNDPLHALMSTGNIKKRNEEKFMNYLRNGKMIPEIHKFRERSKYVESADQKIKNIISKYKYRKDWSNKVKIQFLIRIKQFLIANKQRFRGKEQLKGEYINTIKEFLDKNNIKDHAYANQILDEIKAMSTM
jgi:hypothetical protein